jgi:hypothetical protein
MSAAHRTSRCAAALPLKSTPVKHKAAMGFVSRFQKTAKTECGKVVKVSALAIECATDCPACRGAIEKSVSALITVAASLKARFGESDAPREAEALAAHPDSMYRTIYFL